MRNHLISISLFVASLCSGMDQQPLLPVTLKQSDINALEKPKEPTYDAHAIESLILAAAHQSYPLRFIRATNDLLSSRNVEQLEQLIPHLEQAVFNPQQKWGKIHKYYAINTMYAFLTGAVLAYAFTYDPHAAIIISSVLYLTMRIAFIANTYAQYTDKRQSIELEYALIKEYAQVLRKLKYVAQAYQATDEYKAQRLLSDFAIELINAKKHQKLFKLDGGESLESLQSQYDTIARELHVGILDESSCERSHTKQLPVFSSKLLKARTSQKLFERDEAESSEGLRSWLETLSRELDKEKLDDVSFDTSDNEQLQQALYHAVKNNDLTAFQKIVHEECLANPQQFLAVLKDVKRANKSLCCRKPKGITIEWILRGITGIPYWFLNGTLIGAKQEHYRSLFVTALLICLLGMVDTMGFGVSGLDTIEIGGFPQVINGYTGLAKTMLDLQKINMRYQATSACQELAVGANQLIEKKKQKTQELIEQLQQLISQTHARLEEQH